MVDILSSKHIVNIIKDIIDKYDIQSLKNNLNFLEKGDQKIKVAFLGEFSAGKSTLINALMGKTFLPSFDKPTTAVITEIQKGTEYKFQVIDIIDDVVVTKEISPAELAVEVQKTANERLIKISVPDSDFIDNEIIIIDTPGVSSIHETHSNVTYGYIPTVDVAFLVVNINMGSISKSLREFINQFPEDIKNKFYFILNFSDTKAPSEREKLVKEFTNSICEIIKSPKIFEVSALNAVKANKTINGELLMKSGILEIKDIIKNEIPNLKNEIFEKRRKEELFKIKNTLIEALNEIGNNLNLTDNKLYENIKNLRTEIESVEVAEKSFIKSINTSREKAIEGACEIAQNYVSIILGMFANKQPYAETVAEMYLEIQETLERNLPDFKNLQIIKIDDKDLTRIINDISSKFESKFIAGQEFSKIAMSGLIAAISPHNGIYNIAEFLIGNLAQAEGNNKKIEIEVIKNKSDEEKSESKNTNTKKIEPSWNEMSAWGKTKRIGYNLLQTTAIIIEKTNAFEKLANHYNKNTQSRKLKIDLKSKAQYIVERTYNEIDKAANIFIKENYKLPLQSKVDALEGLRRERESIENDIKTKSEEVNKDLYKLKSLQE